MNMFISACTHVPNSARPAETAYTVALISSVYVYRNETKLCTRVARGKILTVTERFSKFNSYNVCNDVIDDEKSNLQAHSFKKRSVIALGLFREAY